MKFPGTRQIFKMRHSASKLHEQKDTRQGSKTFGTKEINAMVLTKSKRTTEAILGKEFSNIFPFPDEEQKPYFEPVWTVFRTW